MCPATAGIVAKPERISWSPTKESCLVNIAQSLERTAGGVTRAELLLQRWNEANPTLPSTAAALNMQLSRIRARDHAHKDQEGGEDPRL